MGQRPLLIYKLTSYCFLFDFDTHTGAHWCEYVPGRDRPMVRRSAAEWLELRLVFREWLNNVSRESEQPDLWDEVAKSDNLLARQQRARKRHSNFRSRNSKRSPTIYREIRQLILGNAELSSAHLTAVEERLDYLEERSRRMTRRDWANIFVGTIVSLAMERIIDSKLMLEILRLTGHNLGHLFSGGFPSYRARSSRPFKAGAWGLAK